MFCRQWADGDAARKTMLMECKWAEHMKIFKTLTDSSGMNGWSKWSTTAVGEGAESGFRI
jgi:hypothetical protein